MRPDDFRRRLGLALCGAAPLTLFTAAPALSQGLSASTLVGAVPVGISLGAGACSLRAIARVLRALVDEYEALLSGAKEMTVVWSGKAGGPKFLGQASAVLPPGRRPEAILE